ncbi:Hypothetical protein GbCGDNIH6_8222 [Granulibacter bethesdensis]|uniref:hypothetical protein n=1 Tax=Granulibacter bethesdensis TaxID=364410 RepID=UPI00090A3412|nr:hypothetical protein [Granulibacter bethesdensis]APH56872.1 Hypothetical protein GbCGDNIH6_8222 [Granulibacter bethesdensis]
MSIDDYFREQRRLKELMGIDQTASAIAEAHRAMQPLGGLFGNRPRSGLEEVALGLRDNALGSVGAYLREKQSFSTRLSSEFLVGRDAATTATALARQYGDQIGTLNDRIQRDYLGGGFSDTLRQDLTASAIAQRAEISAITRATNWSSGLLARDEAALSSILKASDTATEEMARLQRMATGSANVSDLTARASRGIELSAIRDATTLRMSAFAGALDTFGPRASLGQAAFDALLGTWHTHPDLPAAFWRDRPTRERLYRDADVDPGLVDADSAAVVEVLVDSGVVEGKRTRTGVKAVVEIGPLRMSITTGCARHDAFCAIDAFEVVLRAYIAAKLEAHLAAKGEDATKWFTARVPGNIVGEAKRTRRDAYKAGEDRQPLINFTNLGDLIAVISTRQNWEEVFGAVFGDRDGLKVDLQRLNAHRRPTMHARPIDGLRLAEIVLTIRRLMATMQADGAWVDGWDDDL